MTDKIDTSAERMKRLHGIDCADYLHMALVAERDDLAVRLAAAEAKLAQARAFIDKLTETRALALIDQPTTRRQALQEMQDIAEDLDQPDSPEATARERLAVLEAEQAKATGWGAAVGARQEEIDMIRRKLAGKDTDQ